MFEAAQSALSHLFTPIPLISVLAGAMLGVISGALPGGTVPTLVILLGFAYGMDPYIALPLATGMMATVATGDTLPAVLLGIPGSTSGQATILDGYPMSKQGRAGVALSAAYFSSMIGGVIGALFLFVTIPIARPVVRTFGSAEFFMFSLIAILIVGVLSSGAFTKGLLAGLLGLAIATVGYDPASGTIRSTFGITYLWDGIPIVPVVIGLFALPEFYDMARTEKPIARDIGFKLTSDLGKGRREGIAQVLNNWRLLLRSSIVGVVVGVMPGIGGSLAQWLSYASAMQTVPGGSRTFGSGDVRGVIAPESANNAVDGAQLIPTLMFGVPGSVGMAIFLGFMTVLGIQAGPDMLNQHLDLTLTIVLSLVIANIAATSVLLFFSTSVAKIAFVRPSIVLPLILPVLTLAAFQSSRSYGDLVVMIVFGFLGHFMKVRGWPRPPIIIAIVLGPIVEKYYFIATATYGWAIFARPAVIAIVLVAAATAFYSAWLQHRSAASGREVGASERSLAVGNHGDATSKSAANEPRLDAFPTIAGESGEESNLENVTPSDALSTAVLLRWKDWLQPGPDAIFVCGLLAIFIYDIVASTDWRRGAELLPRSVGYAGVGLVVIYLIGTFRRREDPVGGRRILDVGQAESDVDLAVQRQRMRMAFLTTGGLLGGIWVVGFQLTIPIYVGLYLWRIARVRFAYALLSAAGFVLLLYGFYDWLMGLPWPHPLLADYIPRSFTGL